MCFFLYNRKIIFENYFNFNFKDIKYCFFVYNRKKTYINFFIYVKHFKELLEVNKN